MNHPTRKQIIDKAISEGAEFVVQPNGEKSVSSKNYKPHIMNVKPESKPERKPLSVSQKRNNKESVVK